MLSTELLSNLVRQILMCIRGQRMSINMRFEELLLVRTSGYTVQLRETIMSLTHTQRHTAKALAGTLAEPGQLCTKQISSAMQLLETGLGTHRSTDCASHCRCGQSHLNL